MHHERNLQELVGRLQNQPEIAERLPAHEATVVRAALGGRQIDQIAAEHKLAEETIWEILSNAAGGAGVDKAPRPSQAEGEAPESGNRPSGAAPTMDEAPRPSQAEGDLETVEESLREKDKQS
jgi:hypothetical protein